LFRRAKEGDMAHAPTGFYHAWNSPILARTDLLALRLRDGGINLKILEDIYWLMEEQERIDAREADDSREDMKISHLFWAWILLAGGIGFSIASLAFEAGYKKKDAITNMTNNMGNPFKGY